LKSIYVSDDFDEIEGELDPAVGALYERPGGHKPPLQEGQVTELNLEARHWMRQIAASLDRGYHVAIDYGYLRDEYFAQPRGTLMCYWRHQAVENPYLRIGEQDITAHVNFSDLMEEPSLETTLFAPQKDFLIQLGILAEMEKLAVAGDSVSMQRLLKMKKLILPSGMGERFKVLVQTKR
jgi:SAM-dependent MidA family methyltransferase